MPVTLNILLSVTMSFTIVFFIIPGIIKASIARKLFDVPNTRSAAKRAVPTLGGIAILAGFIVGMVVSSGRFSIDELKYLCASLVIMFVIGINDDIMGSSARRKLAIELVVACYLVIIGNHRFTDLHGILGINQIGYMSSVILSVFAIVGIVNALNLIDGIDGLASGVGILISIVYGLWFLNAGDFLYALTCFSLAGSLTAFFIYNVFGTVNKIFMGDTGSLIVGTVVAVMTIQFNEYQTVMNFVGHGLPAISLAIMIVPVVDTIRVFTIRIMTKKSPFAPDMNHLHHNLLRLTRSHLKSSLIIIGTNGILVLLAFDLIDLFGNNFLFFSLLFSGLILADIPVWILRWKEKKESAFTDPRSVFELISLKKRAG